MNLDKFFAFCLAGALTVGSAGIGWAQQGGDAQQQEDPLAIYRAAGINSDQEQEIRRLAKEFEVAQSVRAKTLLGLFRELQTMQRQADPPEAQVIAKQEEINKVNGEMNTERIKLLLRVRKVLTPEQRQKLVKILSDMESRAQQQGGPQGE